MRKNTHMQALAIALCVAAVVWGQLGAHGLAPTSRVEELTGGLLKEQVRKIIDSARREDVSTAQDTLALVEQAMAQRGFGRAERRVVFRARELFWMRWNNIYVVVRRSKVSADAWVVYTTRETPLELGDILTQHQMQQIRPILPLSLRMQFPSDSIPLEEFMGWMQDHLPEEQVLMEVRAVLSDPSAKTLSPEIVVLIQERLKSEQARLRHAMGVMSVLDIFFQGLRDPSTEVRVSSGLALTSRPTLLRELRPEKLRALAWTLLEGMDITDNDLRRRSVEGLVLVADLLPPKVRAHVHEEGLRRLQSADWQARESGALWLAKIPPGLPTTGVVGNELMVKQLFASTIDGKVFEREAMLQAFRGIAPVVGDMSEELRAWLKEELSKGITSGRQASRLAYAQILAALGPALWGSVPHGWGGLGTLLLEGLESRTPEVRIVSAIALSSTRDDLDPATVKKVREALYLGMRIGPSPHEHGDRHGTTRWATADAMVHAMTAEDAGSKEMIEALHAGLDDTDMHARRAKARALQRALVLTGTSARRARGTAELLLEGGATGEGLATRLDLLGALADHLEPLGEFPRARLFEKLLLHLNGTPSARRGALAALGQLRSRFGASDSEGDAESIRRIVALMKGLNHDVAKAAGKALGDMGPSLDKLPEDERQSLLRTLQDQLPQQSEEKRQTAMHALAGFLPEKMPTSDILFLLRDSLLSRFGWDLSSEEFGVAIKALQVFLNEDLDLDVFWRILEWDEHGESLALLAAAHDLSIPFEQEPLDAIQHEEAMAKLRDALAGATTVRAWEQTGSWSSLTDRLWRVVSTPGLGDLLYSHVIVTLRYLRRGIGQSLGFRSEDHIQNRLPKIEALLARMLESFTLRHDIRSAKRLVRSMGSATGDAIDMLRNRAVDVMRVIYGRDHRDGLLGWMRDRIHTQPSPTDIRVVEAYRALLVSGRAITDEELEPFRKWGYRGSVQAIDNAVEGLSTEKREELRETLDRLLAALQVVYGEPGPEAEQEVLERHVHGVSREKGLLFSDTVIGWLRTKTQEGELEGLLPVVEAYMRFVREDSRQAAAEALTQAGYLLPTRSYDHVDPQKKDAVLQRLEFFSEALRLREGGMGSNLMLHEALVQYERRHRMQYGLLPSAAQATRRFVVSPDLKSMERLSELTQARGELWAGLRQQRGRALIEGNRLDNALEIKLYDLVNHLRSQEMPLDKHLRLFMALVENARLSGYPTREFDNVGEELQDVLQSVEAGKLSKITWLNIYAVLKRVEREIKAMATESVEKYQPMAQVLARKIKLREEEQIWADNFSINLFRSEPVFLLSLILKDLKSLVQEKGDISGLEVIVRGSGEGRLRYVEDLEQLKEIGEDEIIVVAQLPSSAPPVTNVAGIISFTEEGVLTHPATRARIHRIPYVVATDSAIQEKILALQGKYVRVTAIAGRVQIEEIEAPTGPERRSLRPPQGAVAKIPSANLEVREAIVHPEDYAVETVGPKAMRLNGIEEVLGKDAVPPHFSVPVGLYEGLLALPVNAEVAAQIGDHIRYVRQYPYSQTVKERLAALRGLIRGIVIPGAILDEIYSEAQVRFKGRPFMVRSSNLAEDLPGYSGAGLYESVAGVRRRHGLERAMRQVWASVWNENAFYDREHNGMAHEEARMPLIVQEMLPADYSFVINTVDLTAEDPARGLMEVAQGMGEAFSGKPAYHGLPHRFQYSRVEGTVRPTMHSYKGKRLVMRRGRRLVILRTNYREDKHLWGEEGQRLLEGIMEEALQIESAFGAPQDVEGAIRMTPEGWRRVFVQSRDLAGVPVEEPLSGRLEDELREAGNVDNSLLAPPSEIPKLTQKFLREQVLAIVTGLEVTPGTTLKELHALVDARMGQRFGGQVVSFLYEPKGVFWVRWNGIYALVRASKSRAGRWVVKTDTRAPIELGDLLNKPQREAMQGLMPVSLRMQHPLAEIPIDALVQWLRQHDLPGASERFLAYLENPKEGFPTETLRAAMADALAKEQRDMDDAMAAVLAVDSALQGLNDPNDRGMRVAAAEALAEMSQVISTLSPALQRRVVRKLVTSLRERDPPGFRAKARALEAMVPILLTFDEKTRIDLLHELMRGLDLLDPGHRQAHAEALLALENILASLSDAAKKGVRQHLQRQLRSPDIQKQAGAARALGILIRAGVDLKDSAVEEMVETLLIGISQEGTDWRDASARGLREIAPLLHRLSDETRLPAVHAMRKALMGRRQGFFREDLTEAVARAFPQLPSLEQIAMRQEWVEDLFFTVDRERRKTMKSREIDREESLMRQQAMQALGVIIGDGEDILGGEADAIVGIAAESLRVEIGHTRQEAARLLGLRPWLLARLEKEEKDAALNALIEVTAHNDPMVRDVAGEALHSVMASEFLNQRERGAMVRKLLQRARGDSLVEASAAIKALSAYLTRASKPDQKAIATLLLEVLRNRQETKYLEAARAVGKNATEIWVLLPQDRMEIVEQLLAGMRHRSRPVHWGAADGLRGVVSSWREIPHKARVLEELLAIAADRREDTALNAWVAIGRLRPWEEKLGPGRLLSQALLREHRGLESETTKAGKRIAIVRALAAYTAETKPSAMLFALTESALPRMFKEGLLPGDVGIGARVMRLFQAYDLNWGILWKVARSADGADALAWFAAAYDRGLTLDAMGDVRRPARLVAAIRKLFMAPKESGIARSQYPWRWIVARLHGALASPAMGDQAFSFVVAAMHVLENSNIDLRWSLRSLKGRDGGDFRQDIEIAENTLRSVVEALMRRGDVRTAKRLIRALDMDSPNRVARAENLAVQLVVAAEGRDTIEGLVGRIRAGIHHDKGKPNLHAMMAYAELVETDGQSETVIVQERGQGYTAAQYLKKQGYPAYDPADLAPQRKETVLARARELIGELQRIHGDQREVALQDALRFYERFVGGPSEVITQIKEFMASDHEDLMGSLEELTALRGVLAQELRTLDGSTLMWGMRVDEVLEMRVHDVGHALREAHGKEEPAIEVATHAMGLLVENVRLSGHPREEFTGVAEGLEALRSDDPAFWLKLYAVVQRIQRRLNSISKYTVQTYEPIAQALAKELLPRAVLEGTLPDGKLLPAMQMFEDMPSRILRSAISYLLSTYVDDRKGLIREKAGKSGWETIVKGVGVGTVRVIRDPADIAKVGEGDIVILDDYPMDAPPIIKASGVLVFDENGPSSHHAHRAMGKPVPYAIAADLGLLDELKAMEGKRVLLKVDEEGKISWEAAGGMPEGRFVDETGRTLQVQIGPHDLEQQDPMLEVQEFKAEWVGMKAYRQREISAMQAPEVMAVPFGVFQTILELPENQVIHEMIREWTAEIVADPDAVDMPQRLRDVREAIHALEIPGDFLDTLFEEMQRRFRGRPGIVRSSSNAEDLESYSGAGLHDSIGGVTRRHELEEAMLSVWASVWNERAFHDREAHRIPHREVHMAHLNQEMVSAEFAFVMRTADRTRGDAEEVVIDLVHGLGESLVSKLPQYAGSPFRFIYNRATRELRLDSVADKWTKIVVGEDGRLHDRPVKDFIAEFLFSEKGQELLKEIALEGIELEGILNAPQNIEGALVRIRGEWRIAIVQTRDEAVGHQPRKLEPEDLDEELSDTIFSNAL